MLKHKIVAVPMDAFAWLADLLITQGETYLHWEGVLCCTVYVLAVTCSALTLCPCHCAPLF